MAEPPEGTPHLRYALIVLAILLALVAQQVTARDASAPWGWALFLAAVCVAAAATRPGSAPQPPRPEAPRSAGGGISVPCAVAALAGCLLTTALAAANRLPLLAFACWVVSLLAAAAALRAWQPPLPTSSVDAWSRREVGTVALVVLLGAAARFAWIGSLPRYYFADEARVAMYLLQTHAARVPNLFATGWNTWPVLGLSWQGVFAPLRGLDIATLRLSSALMGSLAVLATYLLARELYAPRVAVLAALLLAIGRTAIDFSRLGTCHAQVLLLEPLAFFSWWRAVRRGTARSYLGAGIAIGLCLYTYNAGQSVPVLWAGWLLLCAVLAWRRVRAYWPGVLITMAGVMLTVLPYLWHVTDGFQFDGPWRQTTVMARDRQVIGRTLDTWRERGPAAATAVLWYQVAQTWMGFHLLPARAYGLGYRGGGMLDGVTGPLFILGLALCLAQVLRPQNGFLVYWWLMTTVIGGVLTRDPPAFVRLVGLLPAVAILAALPLDQLLDAPSRRWRVRGTVAVGLLLLAAGWDNWRTYFVEFPRAPIDLASDLARRLEPLPRSTRAYLLGSEYAWRARGWQTNQFHFGQELFRVNFRGQGLVDVADSAHLLPLHEAPTSPLVLVLGPTQIGLIDYVRALYPHARVTDVVREEGGLTYRLLELAPEDLVARAGLQCIEYDDSTISPARVADPFARLPALAGEERWRLWRGLVYWPSDRPLLLTARTSGPAEIQIGGISIIQPDGPQAVDARLQLSRGWQPLVIDERADTEHMLALEIGNGGKRPLTRWDLRPDLEPEGLSATYERDGQVLEHTVDPLLNSVVDERLFEPRSALPVRMPFAVTWRGALRVTQAGAYRLEVHSTGPFSLRLDGQPLLERKRPTSTDPVVSYTTHELSAGEHPIEVRWDCTQCSNQWRRVFQLYWKPPGGQRELISPPHFVPEPAPPPARMAAEGPSE